jgi:hypothetical protein
MSIDVFRASQTASMGILSRLKTALIRGKFALNTDVLNTVLHRFGSFAVDYCQSMGEIEAGGAFV